MLPSLTLSFYIYVISSVLSGACSEEIRENLIQEYMTTVLY